MSNAAAPGYVTLALHAHAPYMRQSGRSGHGEEPLHDLIAGTYLPMLAGLYELLEQRRAVRLALAISPILLEQLADPVVQKHTLQTLEATVERAQAALGRLQPDANSHVSYLAQFYLQLHSRNLQLFERKFGRNLVNATRVLAEQGVVEVVMTTATNVAFGRCDRLMLRAQLESGMIATMRHLGQRPTLLWAANEALTPDLLDLLPELGLSGVIGAPLPAPPAQQPAWLDSGRQIVGLPPNDDLAQHVRSVSMGYPGDFLYRSSRCDAATGERYWRNADDLGSPHSAQWYDPFHAYGRARLHARHFITLLEEATAAPASAPPRLACLATDMEIFGSGWFEGAIWLRALIEELDQHPALHLTLPREFLEHSAPTRVLAGPSHRSAMLDGDLWSASRRLRELAEQFPGAHGARERALNQACRELLLAYSDDWDRLHAAGSYASQRRAQHLARFERLIQLCLLDSLSRAEQIELDQFEELDNPFPFLNYRLFVPKAE